LRCRLRFFDRVNVSKRVEVLFLPLVDSHVHALPFGLLLLFFLELSGVLRRQLLNDLLVPRQASLHVLDPILDFLECVSGFNQTKRLFYSHFFFFQLFGLLSLDVFPASLLLLLFDLA
jgi:hypothetical protein